MVVRTVLASCICAIALGLGLADANAAVIVPAKNYFKPDEAVIVKFQNEKTADGKKMLEEFGVRAAMKMPDLFANASTSDIIVGNEGALFTLYTLDGKKLDFTASKVESDGSVNISAFYPQVKEAGTYVLVWKDAIPLVIETLNNPGRTKADYEKMKDEIDHLSPAEKAEVMKTFQPTVTHIVSLQYGVITTDKGVIKAKFAYDAAPHTVDNFVTLANQGFYDGSNFHRIVPGFMIQGGDSTSNIEGREGSGGPGYGIMAEFGDKLHERGTLSMARSQDINSGGSQFFIMHAKTTYLDGQYAAFGDVMDGMDVVDEIAKLGDSNGIVAGAKPKIVSIRILPATAEMYELGKK